MDSLKMHSPDLCQTKIAKIRELFPSCVTETRNSTTGQMHLVVDFDQLRQELSDKIVEGPQERYRLDWPGKREALVHANEPIKKTLRPIIEESREFSTTKNLFIEGDNLEALKIIQTSFLERIKLIYIDPPYNTGGDLIYRDTFASDQFSQEIATGERTEEGVRLVANPEGNGRFHSTWLTMITSRLRLAKNLLTRDGSIFVSCDECEQPRLRLIMDEIFGQNNFIADMVWSAGRKNNSRFISVSHEYIVCYARDKAYLHEMDIKWRQRKKGLDEIYSYYKRLKRQHGKNYKAMTRGIKEWYEKLPDWHPSKNHKHYSHVDAKGLYFPSDISAPGGGGGQSTKYSIRSQKNQFEFHPAVGELANQAK